MSIPPVSLSSFGYVDAAPTVSQPMASRNVQAPTLNALSSRYTTSISAYGQIKSPLNTFKPAAQALTADLIRDSLNH
jgi:hypothetical protein